MSARKTCEWCLAWEGTVARVFASQAEFAASPYYGGGDTVVGDPHAEVAVWPGKNNVGRKPADWWICTPVHPNCSHGWLPWTPPTDDTMPEEDLEAMTQDMESAFAAIGGRTAKSKSATYRAGIWEEPTCACHGHEPESWIDEYLRREVR